MLFIGKLVPFDGTWKLLSRKLILTVKYTFKKNDHNSCLTVEWTGILVWKCKRTSR
jgi:hypothetical protein